MIVISWKWILCWQKWKYVYSQWMSMEGKMDCFKSEWAIRKMLAKLSVAHLSSSLDIFPSSLTRQSHDLLLVHILAHPPPPPLLLLHGFPEALVFHICSEYVYSCVISRAVANIMLTFILQDSIKWATYKNVFVLIHVAY